MTRSRVPAGVPTGGQFAVSRRSESTQSLGDENNEWENALVSARRSAGYWSRKYGVDADEATADAMLALVSAWKRNGKPTYARTYIDAAARSAALAQRGSNAPTNRARAKLRQEIAKREQEEGRNLRPSEIDQLADEIRMAQPTGRRANAGYQRATSIMSWDGIAPDLLDKAMRNYAPPGHAPSSQRDQDTPSITEAWAALAGSAPRAVPESMTAREASRSRATVAQAGGASKLAADWAAGIADEDATEALFRPFGHMTGDGRYQVFTVLRRYPSYADGLWSSAVSAATVSRRKTMVAA